ncbi:MAG: ASKHA domain-containing protein [Candidatus Bathyarchaeota archaeon]|nr:ASKHA domain-containing protein [Candidatus Bathyarchaeota archaeon]
MPVYDVVFQPDGRRGRFNKDTTILQAARELGVDINTICGGAGSCGKCIVKIIQGGEKLSEPTYKETQLLGKDDLRNGFRLACLTEIKGDSVVLVPKESRTGTQRLQTEGLDTPVSFEPHIRKITVGDETTIFHGDRAIDTLTSDTRILGFSVDIGSTKLAGYLIDLSDGSVLGVETAMNPQIPYGEDIISRLTYALRDQESWKLLHESLVEGIDKLLKEACIKADVSPMEVYEHVLVGNTTMQHFFLGLDIEPLTHSPFTPANLGHRDVSQASLGLGNPMGNIHVLPLIAGFVGADCVAAILATEVYKSDDLSFLIDIGTNTEIVIGNKDRLVACSCASGPAFEGAHIKHGMRAASGAIEGVWIDQDTLEPAVKTIDDAEPVGVCGSGLIDALSGMLRTGIIDTSGRIRTENQHPRIRKNGNTSEYVLVWKKDSALREDIVLTQLDVRELQKGKAAMFSGAHIAMTKLGVTASEVKKVYIAGAFGTYINRESAINVGMLPEFPLMNIEHVGNAAGTGARMALISKSSREEAKSIAKKVEYIELASQPEYNKAYMDSLMFPHLDLSLFPETIKKLEDHIVYSQIHQNRK